MRIAHGARRARKRPKACGNGLSRMLQWRANRASHVIHGSATLRIVELDILRFLSTLSVLLHHYLAWYSLDFPRGSVVIDGLFRVFQYAFVCLPLFFLISGFVIFMSASGRSARSFAIGRIVRLYPTYWLCMTITAGYALLSGVGEIATVSPATYLVNLSMLQSFLGFEDVDIVYWTLAVELQFYLCILVLLWTGVLQRVRVWLAIWTALTISYMVFSQPFFLPAVIDPWYSPFFIAGISFAMIRREGTSVFYRVMLLVSLVLASIDTYDSTADFIANPTVFDRGASVFVIGLFYAAFYLVATKRVRMKPSPMWALLGGITYPLYLIHNKAGKILMHAMEPGLGPKGAIAITTVLALALSYGIFLLIEKNVTPPFRAGLVALLSVFRKQKKAGANPG
ncbi:MAG: acyltransferase [Gemmatimonadetes bacterium]|nr:acyltransferase [Gemmatimonadota bacterium]